MAAFDGADHVGQNMLPDKDVLADVFRTDCQLVEAEFSAYYLIAFGFEQEAYEEKLMAGLLAAAVTQDYGCLSFEDNEQAAGIAYIGVSATLHFQSFAVLLPALPDTVD